MKIAMIVRHFWLRKLTAIPRVVFEISNELIENRVEVAIFTDKNPDYPDEITLNNGLKIFFFQNVNEVFSNKTKFDIYHFYGSLLGSLFFVSKIRGEDVILSIYTNKASLKDFLSISLKDFLIDRRILFTVNPIISSIIPKFVLKRNLKRSKKIIVNSKRFFDFYSNIIENKNKVSRLLHGVDFEKFSNIDRAKIFKLKRKLGFSLDDKIILYLGHNYLVRGIDDLINSMEKVYKKCKKAKLLLVLNEMPGSNSKYIKKLVSKKLPKESAKIIFKYVKNVELYYHISNVVVFPYRLSLEIPEYPLALLEALSCGKAVIATKIGAIPEILVNNYNGILVRPKCKNDLENAILKLLRNNKLSLKIGKNGRNSMKKFDWKIVSKKMLNYYEGI